MGALAGSGKRHHQLGLGHLQDVPERSRGTHREPRRNSDRTPNGGGTCGATTGHPLPAAGKGARDSGKPGKASGGCPLRHRDHGRDTEVGPGSAPLPFHAPPSDGGRRGEGPADRARRAVPFAKECPSLGWRGLGPARESATSPHRSIGNKKRGGEPPARRPPCEKKGNEAGTTVRNTGLRFSLAT